MIRRFSAGLALLATLTGHADAQDAKKTKEIANNFSHQNLICSSYYYFVGQCLEKADPKDRLVKQYRTGAETFLQRGIDMARVAGVSDKAINAKMELAIEDMKSETDNDCVNIAVLLKKHAKTCKSTMDDGPAILLEQYKAAR
ncbi:hypothetical protein [uncultured Bradyrhizobium sp.]|uniref:hypothetical protein n=1 Tax=uncultured Bradyrhizobium sp. TaxID=199684 RepID=UPI0035CCA520